MQDMRAAMLMVLAMGLFACEDALFKALSVHMPVGQMLAIAGATGALVFWFGMRAMGQRPLLRDTLRPVVVLRNLAEAVAASTYISALVLGGLGVTAAVLQALPLVITLGAALFLGEKVGWRRWSSIILGFVGVMLVVQPPAGQGLGLPAVLAIIGTLALAVRDLATRRVPAVVGSGVLTASAFGVTALAGLGLVVVGGQPLVWPGAGPMAGLMATVVFGLGGYMAMVVAMRLAEIAVIAPYRYARLVFSMILGAVFFAEAPSAQMLLGAAIIMASGLYAMWREARLRR